MNCILCKKSLSNENKGNTCPKCRYEYRTYQNFLKFHQMVRGKFTKEQFLPLLQDSGDEW